MEAGCNLMTLYILSVWIHILAAALWVGGMLFLALVLIPALRRWDQRGVAATLVHHVGVRFRWLGWLSLLLLVLTGSINVAMRGFGWSDLVSSLFWRSMFGQILGVKLLLVALTFLLSAIHDFLIGPRATRLGRQDPDSPQARKFRRQAAWMGRLNLLIGLLIVALGVMLVRGWPW